MHWKDGHHDPEKPDPRGFPDIPAAHHPEGGLYDSNDPATLDRHIDLALRARLSGFIVSWAVRPRLDCAFSCPPDVPQFIDWKKVRSAVSDNIFLVADLKSPYLDNLIAIAKDLGFDGWHFYIMAMELYLGVTPEQYYDKVRELASKSDMWFAATVNPGYDDTKLFDRNFTFVVDREDGNLFKRMLRSALALKPFAILVTSFNEWHEGTEIEPSIEFGDEFISILASF